jgi:N-acetylneuraminate synthase
MLQLKSVYIIAEAGVNHNGSIDMAKLLIDEAVEAGADAVKFQTFKAEKLATPTAPKARYQTNTTDSQETQYEMLKKLEMDDEFHQIVIEYCLLKSIQFLSTPFDIESLHLLNNKYNIPLIKLSSGDITNGPLLLSAARTGKPIILSTGMSTIGEIEAALGVLAFGYLDKKGQPSLISFEEAFRSIPGQEELKRNVSILHCTTEYPAPFSEVNLNIIDTFKSAFGLRVGYSDHTTGVAVPIGAVAKGATIIEKHFTLDKKLPGPDHKASLEPDELKIMVRSIREIECALGNSIKRVTESESKNVPIARKSIVAGSFIKKGESFTYDNLAIKRPGTGISPLKFWDILGKRAEKDYEEDEVIDKNRVFC